MVRFGEPPRGFSDGLFFDNQLFQGRKQPMRRWRSRGIMLLPTLEKSD
jgi:hypothetical protein